MEKCTHCKIGIMVQTEQDSYVECTECGCIRLTYEPMDYQEDFHKDGAKYKAFFGGRKSIASK